MKQLLLLCTLFFSVNAVSEDDINKVFTVSPSRENMLRNDALRKVILLGFTDIQIEESVYRRCRVANWEDYSANRSLQIHFMHTDLFDYYYKDESSCCTIS